MVTTGTQTTNKVKNPTKNELNDYKYALHELISHSVMYIKGYETNRFELMYIDYQHEKIMRCAKIAYNFMKKYPKFKF